MCSACFVASLLPQFDSPKWRAVRGFMFLGAGCSIIVVFIAILGFKNSSTLPINITLYAIGGVFYIVGALLYVFRFPERCKPGAFDLCGASH